MKDQPDVATTNPCSPKLTSHTTNAADAPSCKVTTTCKSLGRGRHPDSQDETLSKVAAALAVACEPVATGLTQTSPVLLLRPA